MKKAIKINLSGLIFHIDDDAYEKLKAYLDTISRHFSNKEESKEIIDDIEARIAELFQERISDETQVITVAIVNEVIDIMGNPEDIADSGEETERQSSFHETYSGKKRLYRDPEPVRALETLLEQAVASYESKASDGDAPAESADELLAETDDGLDDSEAHWNMGVRCQRQGGLNKAASAFRRSLELKNPQYAASM